MNKSKTLFVVLVMIVALPSFSQGFKLVAFGGYTFKDKVYGYNGDLIIQDGAHYGGVLSYEKSDRLSIDLTYSRQETSFGIYDYYNSSNGSVKGSVNYIMLGATRCTDFSAKVAP